MPPTSNDGMLESWNNGLPWLDLRGTFYCDYTTSEKEVFGFWKTPLSFTMGFVHPGGDLILPLFQSHDLEALDRL
jgi:hypothetical protein